MNEQAAHLVDRVLTSEAPYRQWILTMPWDLSRAIAYDASLCAAVMAIFAAELERWHCKCARDGGVRSPHAGSIIEVQRFADGATLFPHGHALSPQGVFEERPDGSVMFHRVRAPKDEDVLDIVTRIENRVRKLLGRRGLLQSDTDEEDGHEPLSPSAQLLLQCAASSPMGREAVPGTNPRGGRAPKKVTHKRLCAKSPAGFELHAGGFIKANDEAGLERTLRYMSRPPIPQERLRLRDDGLVEFYLKRAWKGGVRKLVFDTLSLIARIAALVPPPGFNHKRFYGVYAPNHPLRSRIVPVPPDPGRADRPVAPKRPAEMAWSDLLRRVFLVDVLKCTKCGGRMRFIAHIQDPDVVDVIVAGLIMSDHLDPARAGPAPPSRRTTTSSTFDAS